jgi:hypothetical protein
MKTLTIQSKVSSILAIFVISILAFSNNTLAKVNDITILSSSAGYPYNLLIQRSDQILLSYQGDELVQCRVEVKRNKQIWQGTLVEVKADEFSQDPLKSCLSRRLAKDILAATFD